MSLVAIAAFDLLMFAISAPKLGEDAILVMMVLAAAELIGLAIGCCFEASKGGVVCVGASAVGFGLYWISGHGYSTDGLDGALVLFAVFGIGFGILCGMLVGAGSDREDTK